jgi:hypothetical protein
MGQSSHDQAQRAATAQNVCEVRWYSMFGANAAFF